MTPKLILSSFHFLAALSCSMARWPSRPKGNPARFAATAPALMANLRSYLGKLMIGSLPSLPNVQNKLILALLKRLPFEQHIAALQVILRKPSGRDSLISSKIKMRLAVATLEELSTLHRARVIDRLLRKPVVVNTPHGMLRFLNHSRLAWKRAETILTKEPDTLRWIDAIEPGSVFWDIGANIGVLTLYAAARKDLNVWAFEPAAVNYYNLAANCELNGVDDQVHCLQLGFSDINGIEKMRVSQLMSGHSFSFKKKRHLKPGRTEASSRQSVQVCTIDDFIRQYGAPIPNYIKIDVPGLTQEILIGARETLLNPALKQIQIEAREHAVGDYMKALGFKLVGHNNSHEGQKHGDLVFARAKIPANILRLGGRAAA